MHLDENLRSIHITFNGVCFLHQVWDLGRVMAVEKNVRHGDDGNGSATGMAVCECSLGAFVELEI